MKRLKPFLRKRFSALSASYYRSEETNLIWLKPTDNDAFFLIGPVTIWAAALIINGNFRSGYINPAQQGFAPRKRSLNRQTTSH
jgi:hypothetical protein